MIFSISTSRVACEFLVANRDGILFSFVDLPFLGSNLTSHWRMVIKSKNPEATRAFEFRSESLLNVVELRILDVFWDTFSSSRETLRGRLEGRIGGGVWEPPKR